MLVICVDWGGLQHHFDFLVLGDVGFARTVKAPPGTCSSKHGIGLIGLASSVDF